MSEQFKGVVGRTFADSKPYWAPKPKAPEGAPNVIQIVLDDVGFGWVSCFGGPVNCPAMDRLAANGLRYTNFHTTALCSPTRACLLTGRNHHSVNMAAITELATGFPGYNGLMPKNKATVAAYLRHYNYNTFWLGKNHNVPDSDTGPAGPYDRRPNSDFMGFDRFYGFLGGDSHQYYPALFQDNHPVEPPYSPEEGYHLSVDIVDRAIEYISNHDSVAPDKPWFMHLAFGACHAPHHVPKEWADKYKGKFDQGWDKVREETLARQKKMGIVPANARLSPMLEGTQKWDTLSVDEKKLFARMAEIYAGFLEQADAQIGRLVKFLEETGDLDNTLIFVHIGDNGSSGEGTLSGLFNEMSMANNIPEDIKQSLKRIDELGGPNSYNHYPVGWAFAGNTPFKLCKQYTHYGGTKNPLIVHWPKRIKAKGEFRWQFCHAIDMVPTILEAAGVEMPAEVAGVQQAPIEGISILYSFNDAKAPEQHTTQYFEMLGNRGIYHDGWKAVTYHGRKPWENKAAWTFDEDQWELYNVNEDWAEANDLIAGRKFTDLKDPMVRKLIDLVGLWWAEAGKYNVLPLDDRLQERFAGREVEDRKEYIFYPGSIRIPEGSSPPVKNRSHSIEAVIEVPRDGAEGPICAVGGVGAGWSLYIKDGKLNYCHNFVQIAYYYVRSTEKVPVGRSTVRFEFEKTGKEKFGAGGIGRLFINGKKVGEAEILKTVPFRYSLDESFDVGCDTGTAVTPEYKPGAKFTGKITQVKFVLSGESQQDPEMATKHAMMRQ
ncbi:MAG: arylsulfatase [Candidatus Bathyarchaeia archaeon]